MNQVVNFKNFDGAHPLPAKLDAEALDRLFREARTHNAFLDTPVPHALLEEAVELAKMGPTAVNTSPLRIVFVETDEGKALLEPSLAEGNLAKTMAAPVTAIVGFDMAFYDKLPKLFPHADARAWFVGNDAFIDLTARQSGTLQAAYFILALRAVGLDAGPMGGFDNAKVDEAFFAGTTVKSNFLINIGYGDADKLYPRSPRLDFEEIASFA
ncbi:malonic semialdehyde reductase [Bauldia litoralis]|uniref:Putative NADH dehydrogenase/NAD(P)H nitroreductase SAMN02982931_00703 n=1 Tax=Bauldia litoralis TaxID=665467 RepID=A0A1G6AIW2_9HYPH|nr:3-hydroxypropanoate dehydrogenase [Bauldia litoralis]